MNGKSIGRKRQVDFSRHDVNLVGDGIQAIVFWWHTCNSILSLILVCLNSLTHLLQND